MKKLTAVAEQTFVFDGQADLYPAGLALEVLTHKALCSGASQSDVDEILKDDAADNPRLYRVQVHVYVEDLTK